MNKPLIFLSIILLFMWGYYQWNGSFGLPPKYVTLSEGININCEPIQQKSTTTDFIILIKDKKTKIVPLFDIIIIGVVRCVKEAPFLRDIVVKSCVISWGQANREEIQKQIHWGKLGGFSYESEKTANIVRENFSNFYLIGANDNLKKAISKIKEGQYICVKGYQVDVFHPDGNWVMEPPIRIRTDMCNMIWVTELIIENKSFQ